MKNNEDELEDLKHLAQPFYFKGSSKTGILLVHGFTASPTEMLPLGEYLNKKGYTVLGVRLAGHGTKYTDMTKFTWQDWYNSVEKGFLYLQENFSSIIPIGMSMGALLCQKLVQKMRSSYFPKLVLLAPPFALKSRLATLAPIIKIFVKYSYKGVESLQYFKTHNLYSYMYRPTISIIELNRLIKHLNGQNIKIEIPTLILFGSKDEMISKPAIKFTRAKKFSENTDVIIQELPNSGHILTVEPDSERMFEFISSFISRN